MTPRFILRLDLDGDAFQPVAKPEVIRLLRRLADRLEEQGTGYEPGAPILDANGNTCGFWEVQA